MTSHVDWSIPDAKPDAVYGTGALREERLVAVGLGVAAAAVVPVLAAVRAADWAPWQYLLAAVVVFDLVGGVAANGLNSAKRDHFAEDSPLESSWSGRVVRRPVLFAALHVQPVLVGLLFPGAPWWWGPACYLAVLASVVLVRRTPLYLQRPVALSCCALAAVAGAAAPAPHGFGWLPAIMFLKLTLAHAVREEPYRPGRTRGGGR